MNPTVLLVDVPSADRENWRTFLENYGYRVVVADNAESARQLCLQLQPDLVLLHDRLRDIRASDLCRRLMQDPLNRLTPVVLVSSSATPAEAEQGREAGAADFWGPPSSLWNGLGRIESLLRLKRYIDEQANSVVLSLVHSVEAKHPMTERHSDRLVDLAMQLGDGLGLAEADLHELRLGCWLHDIGKVAVPDNILLKPGPLNPQETEIIRQHPVTGEKICAPLKSLRPILPMIRHHHERLNGSGYPDGLWGEEIPLKARIVQVADVYDALTNDRPYRKALSCDEAQAILRQEAMYGWLDASLVWKFLRICRSGAYQTYQPIRGHSMLASYYR